jgi:hypothetical protein
MMGLELSGWLLSDAYLVGDIYEIPWLSGIDGVSGWDLDWLCGGRKAHDLYPLDLFSSILYITVLGRVVEYGCLD